VGFLEDWDLSYDEINELLTDNPSLRSFVMGYAAEMKCRRMFFEDHPEITSLTKYDDHDRVLKGDIAFTYRDQPFTVEVKSLQTNSLKRLLGGPVMSAKFQCDASDRRWVKFKDGSTIETTCLLVGEFDLLAVNLHSFEGEWDFTFAKNADLPRVNGLRGKSRDYTQYQRSNLLMGTMPMMNPPIHPYNADPFVLLDELIEARRQGTAPVLAIDDIEDEEEDGA
jgi:hypothetical protein